MPSLPRPGDRLAGFRIERELGHGTTGVVYLAHQVDLDRQVALKVVGRPLADDAAFRERFRREARAVAGLDHPNVVQVLGTGEDDAHLWLAMRLVDGPDLRVLLRRTGRLDPEQAVVVVEQVAAALDAAHAAGLVHRDVKPGNVLIEDGPGRDLHVELADFGLARAPGLEDPEGTPGYAAPEQLAGEDAGPAADVHGLGCVLFELLTGQAPPAPPAPGEAARPSGLRPSDALPRLGGAFDPAVERATDPDPAARFASAGELALWARAALTVPREPSPPVEPRRVRAAAASPATPDEVLLAAPTWEIPPAPRPRHRGRRLLVAAFLAVVLAALATAFVFIGGLGRADHGPLAGRTTTAAGSAGRTSTGVASPSAGGAAAAGGAGAIGRAGAAGGAATAAGRAPKTGRTGGGSRGAGAAGGDASRPTTPTTDDRSDTGTRSASPAARAARGGVGTRSPGTVASLGGERRGSVDASGEAPRAGAAAPSGTTVAALPPLRAGATRFGGGTWALDLPTSEGWRQTATQELDGGARLITRLQRADRVRLVVEALPGQAAVVGVPGARPFVFRLPEAGRGTGAVYRGGRYRMCREGVCAALPANGPGGGVLLVVGGHRADGTIRVARRAAAGLRTR